MFIDTDGNLSMKGSYPEERQMSLVAVPPTMYSCIRYSASSCLPAPLKATMFLRGAIKVMD